MNDMYAENIMDYFKNPRNFGTLGNADIVERGNNPVCGDEIELFVKLNGSKKIEDIKFKGKGCAISQAAVSMLTEFVKGKTLEEAKQITNQDIFDLVGVPLSPIRVKCALLGLKTLELGIQMYEAKQKQGG